MCPYYRKWAHSAPTMVPYRALVCALLLLKTMPTMVTRVHAVTTLFR